MRVRMLGRLLRSGVGGCSVRMTGRSLMRLMRLSSMRVMLDRCFVSFGEQARNQQSGTGERGSKQRNHQPLSLWEVRPGSPRSLAC
jgi:hypothetical protein